MPVLGQQPPLLGNVVIRLVHTEEEPNEQDLVRTYPYYEESQSEQPSDVFSTLPASTSSSEEIEASYQMDHNTLMFIAQGGMSKPMPNPRQKLFKHTALEPCYGCGRDHWFRDCPMKKDRVPSIPPITRFCMDCGIKHLVADCPVNPINVNKVNVNMIRVVSS